MEETKEFRRPKILKEWMAHGLLCRVTQHPAFHTHNGYVRVEKGHPFYRAGYNMAVALNPNKARLKDSIEDVGFGGMLSALCGDADKWMKTPDGYLKVHGGVTYTSKKCPGEAKAKTGSWWIGWDSGHAGDYSPGDLQWKVFQLKTMKDFPELHTAEEIKAWMTYLNRVREGEVERNFLYEAELSKEHYLSFDEAIAENEKLAEQLSVVALLGVQKKKGRK